MDRLQYFQVISELDVEVVSQKSDGSNTLMMEHYV